MKITIIKPSIELITPIDWIKDYSKIIEHCGRVCYKSEDRITSESSTKFIQYVIDSGHLSVIEHLSLTVKFIGDRSMSHQLVRHRIAAYSQESQRYCNYGKKGFQVVCPPKIAENEEAKAAWYRSIEIAVREYLILLSHNIPPEDARSVLPNAIKTEVITTFNLRQWRHVFTHRALNPKAQWQIKDLMKQCLTKFNILLPSVFSDQFRKL